MGKEEGFNGRKDFNGNFYHDLAQQESSGKTDSRNKDEFIGKYQMGTDALQDAGYFKKGASGKKNDWEGGTWTDKAKKEGINNLNDFLKNEAVQDKAFVQ